jgi:ERCC4-type nuclease
VVRTSSSGHPLRPILIDTREQQPLVFPGGVETSIVTLRQGDYSLQGLEDIAVIERKGLGDLVACCTNQRDRFERELTRLRDFVRWPILLVEATMQDVTSGDYRSLAAPQAVIASTIHWHLRYDIPTVWAGTPAHAAEWSLRFFDGIERRTKHMRNRAGRRLTWSGVGNNGEGNENSAVDRSGAAGDQRS